MLIFFGGIPTKSIFDFLKICSNLHSSIVVHFSAGGLLSMVFEHLQNLFDLEDLTNKFYQLFFICFYVTARCIPKNITKVFNDAKLLFLAKPSNGI
jgi:hypothetical protein